VLDHASITIEINNGSMLHTGRINVSVQDAAIPSLRIDSKTENYWSDPALLRPRSTVS